jgi:eukaryotic-like serine/threonine-protein kinase
MPAPATKEDFLDVVRKSQQIDNDRLESYLRSRQAPPLPAEPKKLAALLVREGLLTGFQAEQFLLGKHKGFTLGGYRIIERLGVGGGGMVYLGEHLAMKRRVAIKILPTPHASDLAVLERFRREAQAAAALDHPNIVRAYDFRQEGQMHFLVMEYVNGPSLEDVLLQQGPLPIAVACDYIRQAAIGLQHAHDNGLVHRDVKPANLLVDASGIVKVLDLGLARFAAEGQKSVTQQFDENMVMGTVDYLAPEQAVSLHDVDARADVYSLGATFYALLAGEPPFSEGSVTQKLIWHQMRTPKPIRERRPEVSSDVAGILAAMMAKTADERIQSCAEVATLLEPWASVAPPAQGPAQSGRAAPTGSTASWSKTRVSFPPFASRRRQSQPSPPRPANKLTSPTGPPLRHRPESSSSRTTPPAGCWA